MKNWYAHKKVLVTGGAGFIGSNLACELVSLGAQVVILDNFIPGCGSNPFNLESIKGKIELKQGDLRDLEQLKDQVADCDYIFNLAGNVSHQSSMSHPFSDMELNVRAQLSLLEAVRERAKNAKIVFASTRQVYGVPKYLPVDERHVIDPVDVNGINKLAGERYHRLYAKVYGLKTVCLRLTNTYGPRQLISTHHQGFMGWFLNRAILEQPIKLYGGGCQKRDFNFVSDVTRALLKAAETPACYGGVFNLSGPVATLKEVAEMLITLKGKGSTEDIVFPDEQKKIDIGDYYGDSQLFERLSGWKPETSLEQGLKETLHYYQKNLKYYLPV